MKTLIVKRHDGLIASRGASGVHCGYSTAGMALRVWHSGYGTAGMALRICNAGMHRGYGTVGMHCGKALV
jgi:hypothetical protein